MTPDRAPLIAALLEDWDATQPFRMDVLHEALRRWPDIRFDEIERALAIADRANRHDAPEEERTH